MWKIQRSAKTATERSVLEMVTIWIKCLTKQNHFKSSVSGCHGNTNANIYVQNQYNSILHSPTIQNNGCRTSNHSVMLHVMLQHL